MPGVPVLTAIASHIASSRSSLPMWDLCPVRGCLSFAPVGRHCGAHWVIDLALTIEQNRLAIEAWERYRSLHGAP